jgi:hypothetical protein
MAVASTNEERFVASCVNEGEVGVRQKLNAGRYSERRAVWAGAWLDEVESGKSDATKAAESSGSVAPKKSGGLLPAASALTVVLIGVGVIAYLRLM